MRELGQGRTVSHVFRIRAAERLSRSTRVWEVEGAPDAPTTVLSVGDVLREWRAAERALSGLTPGPPELAQKLSEIGLLRSKYQQLFRAAAPPTDP